MSSRGEAVRYPDLSVRYVEQEQIDKYENRKSVGLSTEGWYFWDETWGFGHGPFETKTEAEVERIKYGKEWEVRRG